MSRFRTSRLYQFYLQLPILWKIRLGMLTVSLSILLSFMGVSILYTYSNMLSSSLDAAGKNLVFSKNNLDNLLSIVENYSVILLSDETLQETLDQKEAPEDFLLSQNEILMRNRMNAITSSFQSINAVLIYDTFGNIYDTGVTLLKEESSLKRLPTELPSWSVTSPAPYYIAMPGATVRPNVVAYTRNIYSYLSGRYIGKLCIFLEESTLSSTYAESLSPDEDMMMLSSQNTVISSPKEASLYQEGIFPAGKLNGKNGHFSVSGNSILYEKYPRLDAYLINVVPRDTIYEKIYQMLWFLCLVGGILIFLCILVSTFISRSLTDKLYRLTSATKAVWHGDWTVRVETEAKDEIGTLTDNFNQMMTEIENRTEKLIEEQRAKRHFQLEFFTQQINPHFLYNTLNNVCALADLNQTKELYTLVNNLTSFYRGVLSEGKIVIPLSQELTLASHYLNIMQIRYHYTFSYDFQIDPRHLENTILKLTLQPLLENAVYHGFETHQDGGRILLRLRSYPSCLLLILEDNGKGITKMELDRLSQTEEPGAPRRGFGIFNVHERIQLYYGSSYGLKLYRGFHGGVRVLIKLPYRNWREKE